MGYAAYGLRDICRARQHLRDALELAAETGSILPGLWALPTIAQLWAECGQTQRAVQLYTLASRYPLVACSCWFRDVFGESIAALVTTLPAEMLKEAQAWGRSCDLDATVVELLSELGEWVARLN